MTVSVDCDGKSNLIACPIASKIEAALKQLRCQSRVHLHHVPCRVRSPVTHRTGKVFDNEEVLVKSQSGVSRLIGSFMKGCSLVATGRKDVTQGFGKERTDRQ